MTAEPILRCDGCGNLSIPSWAREVCPILETLLAARGGGWRIDLKRNLAWCPICWAEHRSIP